MKINDAHCHYGMESIFGQVLRLGMIHNNYEKITRNLDTYNVEHQLLFPVPCPISVEGCIKGALLFLPKMAYMAMKLPIDPLYHLATTREIEFDPERTGIEIYFGKITYSKINQKISQFNDPRIKFIPFVNSHFEPSELDNFDHIEGVKYYESYGKIPDSLLEYLNDNNLNIIPHLSVTTLRKPQNFLHKVARYDGAKFQVPHWAKCIKPVVEALSEYDNLYIDTSNSSVPFTKYLYKGLFKKIAESHPDKILFGSDEPLTSIGNEIKLIKSLGLDIDIEEGILYKNYFKLWK